MQYVRRNLISGIHREVTYWMDGAEVGRFGIYNRNGMLDMSIFIEDEFHGRGFVRPMIKFMFDAMWSESSYDPTALIYIDTDASQGFWDHVGLTPNPYYDDITRVEYGYEKKITVQELSDF